MLALAMKRKGFLDQRTPLEFFLIGKHVFEGNKKAPQAGLNERIWAYLIYYFARLFICGFRQSQDRLQVRTRWYLRHQILLQALPGYPLWL